MWPVVAGFVAGCGLIVLLPELPSPGMLALAGGAIAVLAACVRSAVVFSFVAGAAWCWLRSHAALDDRLDPALEGVVLVARGTVASVPQGGAGLLRFRFEPERADLPRRIELTWYEPSGRPRAAERLELEVRLRRPRGFANPGGSDNDARMLREGIGASGYVRSSRSLGRDWRDCLARPVLVARGAVADAIREELGARPAAGIVAGLSVGLQDALDREQWRQLARTGTSHLMAISGLHIAMVAAIVAWLGGRLQRWRQRRGATGATRDVAVAAGAVAAALYSALAGWSVPTQRTLIMIALAATALRLRRHAGFTDGLAACAGIVLLLDPLALLAPGFWLSFGAVAVILFVTTGHLRRPHALAGYLHVQGAVTLGLVPVLAASFGQLSLVSAVVNLAAIPLYTFLIVPCVLVASACVLVAPAVGGALLRAVAAVIDGTWPLIAVPAQWPASAWAVAGLSPFAWCVLLVGTIAALAPLPARGRWAGACMVVAACLWRPPPLPPGTAGIAVLDVGQGLAVVVETRSHALVFDAGPAFRSGADAGQTVVVPYLQYRGLRSIDRLVVSHDDDDHKGGAASVAAAVSVGRVVAGPSVEALARVAPLDGRCRRGERWTWDGVEFEWLHPGPAPHERDNDSSCVLMVVAGEHRALLTGDVEAEAEAEMLAAGALRAVDIVVAPHHGSRTSSTAAFVAAVRPRWVVFTVGHRNRWRFPAQAVVERWQGTGAHALSTSATGAVHFVMQTGKPLEEPRRWRVEHHRFWQDP